MTTVESCPDCHGYGATCDWCRGSGVEEAPQRETRLARCVVDARLVARALDAVEGWSDEIRFSVRGPFDPIAFTCGRAMGALMPMRGVLADPEKMPVKEARDLS